jgi:imidazolonepropionase-like amidohydrolase
MCVRHGVDVIYHASYISPETIELLAQSKDKHWVAPGVNWLVNTIYEATSFGYTVQFFFLLFVGVSRLRFLTDSVVV